MKKVCSVCLVLMLTFSCLSYPREYLPPQVIEVKLQVTKGKKRGIYNVIAKVMPKFDIENFQCLFQTTSDWKIISSEDTKLEDKKLKLKKGKIYTFKCKIESIAEKKEISWVKFYYRYVNIVDKIIDYVKVDEHKEYPDPYLKQRLLYRLEEFKNYPYMDGAVIFDM